MPKFRGDVRIYASITVEADDMYEADEKARSLSPEEIISLIETTNRNGLLSADFEVFEDELPEEV